jgi:hypothetical protein
MKTRLFLAALLAAGLSTSAQAANYTISFTGDVVTTVGATGRSIGDMVSGSITLIAPAQAIVAFTIDGITLAHGADTSATLTPSFTDALYESIFNPVALGGATNTTLSLDLSSLTSWPSTDTAISLLTDSAQLANNLDTVNNPLSAFPSTFMYYLADSSGNNVTSLTADLTGLSVTVPEPMTLSLLTVAMVGLGVARRR